MGLIETKFKRFAKNSKKKPEALMKELIEAGVTQRALAERLDCTRQAIGRIARKWGLEFPGCEIDIETKAKKIWGMSFEAYIKRYPNERYADMAVELGVSLSTFKRRVKESSITRRGVTAA